MAQCLSNISRFQLIYHNPFFLINSEGGFLECQEDDMVIVLLQFQNRILEPTKYIQNTCVHLL